MEQIKAVRNSKEKIDWIFWGIFLTGCVVRLFFISEYPKGLFTDETFEGWEAYNLATYGIDSWGYHNPIYLVTWGSGMNVLNLYLIIPLVKLLGATNFALRLPHAIISCISLLSIYFLFLKTTNKFCARLALFILAINPWHIMVARWALESNLAPEMLLIGTTFFVYGLDKRKYMIFAALFYGLSLYCYAAIWPIMPIILLMEVIYSLKVRKVKFDRYMIISGIVIVMMAVPLILFLMINVGIINEIVTPFISIPKLSHLRSDEVGSGGLWGILYNISAMYRVLVEQDDGIIWNSLPKFGLYYKFSIPFIMIGFLNCVQRVWKMIRYKKSDEFTEISILILIHLSAFLVQGCLMVANINKINGIHIPMICLNILGIYSLQKYFHKDIMWITLTSYLISFVAFQSYYYSNYTMSLGYTFNDGLEEAVAYTETLNKDVYVKGVAYWEVMYFVRPDIYDYMEEIREEREQAYSKGERFNLKGYGKYHFEYGEEYEYAKENAYVLKKEETELINQLQNEGFEIEVFEHMVVAH